MDTIFEIEQINSRVAADINTQTTHTNQIVSLEEKTREKFLKRDMPVLINVKEQEKLDSQNKVIDTKIPLSQQITEMQNARDLKTKYERELSSFALAQKKTKEQFLINRKKGWRPL